MTDVGEALLEVDQVTVDYRRGSRRHRERAVDEVTLRINAGKTLGLVGESGSGKSTLAKAIVGLVPISSGDIRFAGQSVATLSRSARRAFSLDIQLIFQDPFSSLNPVRTVGQTIAEPLLAHRKMSRSEAKAAVSAVLARVGLPSQAAERFPWQFSGGQRQRIAVARALVLHPRLVICDEPVSALDLSVQAQVLNLFKDLQDELGLTYLFISHDLAVVRHMADEIAVIYRGQLMEWGDVAEVTENPRHPYTQSLLATAPLDYRELHAGGRITGQVTLGSQEMSAAWTGVGCPFAPRCPLVAAECRVERPPAKQLSTTLGVACHKVEMDPPGTQKASTKSILDRSRGVRSGPDEERSGS
jgi:oligopeptide/dipeptide ABC transporter ATP-binding protein